jgi:hypothetical protein
MSLSQVIAKLEHDESIKFTRERTSVRVVVKKGDEREEHKQVIIMVDPQSIDQFQYDELAVAVDEALTSLRK